MGNPNVAAVRVIGKEVLLTGIRRLFVGRKIVALRLQSRGKPKIVLTVISGPRAKYKVMLLPLRSAYGVK